MSSIIREYINEIVRASDSYLKKEKIRSDVQEILLQRIKSGEITDDSALKEFFETADMALKALSGVPYEVWEKLSKQ